MDNSMSPEVKARIESLIQDNKILVFMKGNKLMPQCGFSNNVVQILNVLGVPFETVDVLADSDIRQGIKDYSNWPTIPQVYINGEFVGGSDILIELYQNGQLQEIVEVAMAS
jgi:monothiol glutaredoxin